MDWGLAKVRTDARGEAAEGPAASTFQDPRDDAERLQTRTGSFLGTPAFMAPEQAIGAVDQVDERTDVFGLGAVLCTILTGQPPFVGDTAESTRQLAAQGKLGDAFARLDGCGAELELVAVCNRCLSAERADRPWNAGAVEVAVQALRAAAEERARQAELERARAEVAAAEQRKRRRVQLALGCAVLVLAAGGGAFAWWHDRVTEEARLRAARFEGEQKAQQAAFDTERTLKAEQAQQRARNLLAFASDARREYRFVAAEGALGEAGELAANLAPQFVGTVGQARADLAFVQELDDIRMKRSTWIAEEGAKGHFDAAGAPLAYRAAFAARGLDVAADPADVGARVAASAVRGELVTALDDWAVLETDEAVRDRVLAVLGRADGDSGAAPFRDPAVWADRAGLEALAARADVGRLSPGAVVAIAEVMRQRKADAAPLLRHAMSLHPREFLIAFTLGQILDERDPERVGAYRAARSIRPDNTSVLNNLGVALEVSGDLPGAIAVHREATPIAGTLSVPHSAERGTAGEARPAVRGSLHGDRVRPGRRLGVREGRRAALASQPAAALPRDRRAAAVRSGGGAGHPRARAGRRRPDPRREEPGSRD
jgi:serine/threonine-protein kinase